MSLKQLKNQLQGELFTDVLMQTIYATDASVYSEMPLAVAFPKTDEDIQKLIFFAAENNTTLIPRTAGTSLAGQCVGDGIIVDVSKHFTQILETNVAEKTVTVQPGVIRDILNLELKQKGLFFGPETSTANRAMIGGMVGNNSSGSNSIKYGVTRDHVLEIEAFLSDGSQVVFKELSKVEFEEKLALKTFEGNLYRHIYKIISSEENRKAITSNFPKASIHRRNTGYALDALIHNEVFDESTKKFNFCKLIAGSEGTLAFMTKIKLQCFDLPPKYSVLVCPHFNSVQDALKSVELIMKHKPFACELMDKVIMDCTKENIEYNQYRFFVEKDPEAILIVELKAETEEKLLKLEEKLQFDLENENIAYAIPKVYPPKTKDVWQLRKAGLGLLANLPGEKKAVAVIEDTAVALEDLPNYIKEFTVLMNSFNQQSVYYAHAGAGEIHLRPILDLKKQEGVDYFKDIAFGVAKLVKKYQGSLSGEHGDGRVRASFLNFMVGDVCYQLLKEVKHTWDQKNVFNAGKIIAAKPIDTNLRYEIDRKEPEIETLLDFSETGGILNLAEKCNGSGDCRKLAASGGTMCPSYMATKEELTTTRARANVLRVFLTNPKTTNRFNQAEIKEALDLCLSCKGCKAECPSNVDMAAMKAEFLYQYQKENGVSFKTKMFAETQKNNVLASKMPRIVNFLFSAPITSTIVKKVLGVAPQRTIPKFAHQTLKAWFKKNQKDFQVSKPIKTAYLFADEFTNHNDVEIGKKAIKLLHKLNYQIIIAAISDSARTYISKGILETAQKIAIKNVLQLAPIINTENVFVGIEPSAILSFRDEYIRLLPKDMQADLKQLNTNTFLIDEFLASELDKGNIKSNRFTTASKSIKLHGHCHQKALSKISATEKILSLPINYNLETIASGCCGMAGSFGYEKEHYDVSMQIGELVLFPAVRKAAPNTIIAATGTSCRHQIKDGTDKDALHPIEILFEALV
ncbi:MAG: FAD-binding and (Fe-S)-binding domain-containing protein [Chitinophagales bacterium]